jgi:hypothetical protein
VRENLIVPCCIVRHECRLRNLEKGVKPSLNPELYSSIQGYNSGDFMALAPGTKLGPYEILAIGRRRHGRSLSGA